MRYLLVALALVIALAAYSCDVIDMPYTKATGGNSSTPAKRKVLLEEFTGITCSQCPEGHREAERLKKALGDGLITMTIHATSFAEPTKKCPTDFRTPEAETMWLDFQKPSLPSGMINRMQVSGSWTIGRKGWGDMIQNLLDTPAEISLELNPTFDAVSSTMSLHCTTRYLKRQEKKLWLSLYVVEDDVVAAQIDGTAVIPDYVHHNVFRAAPLGIYGKELSTTALVEANTVVTQDYRFPITNPSWNIDHCKIIAFVHYNSPDYTILQAEEVAVRK